MHLEERILAYLNDELSGADRQLFEQEIYQNTTLKAQVEATQEALTLLQVHDYLDGLLSDEKAEAFEAKLANNLKLQEAVRQREHIQTLLNIVFWEDKNTEIAPQEREEFLQLIHTQSPQTKPKQARTRMLLVFRIAAGILILLTAGILGILFLQSPSNQSLATAAFEIHPVDNFRGNQGTTASTRYEKAMWAYHIGEYSTAIELLSTISSSDSKYAMAQFLLGNAYFATKNYPAASTTFQTILTHSSIPVLPKYRVQWYLALASLANDDEPLARELLEKLSDNEEAKSYRTRALALLAKMSR